MSSFCLGRVLCVCSKTLLSLAAQPLEHANACARAAHIRTKLAGMARFMSQTVQKASKDSVFIELHLKQVFLEPAAVVASLVGETSRASRVKIEEGIKVLPFRSCGFGLPVRFA